MLTATKMGAWKRLWFEVMMFALRRGGEKGSGSCANRRWHRTMFGSRETRLVLRDTTQEDGYSRMELYEMLRTVRLHERRQGWECPEPTFRNQAFAERFVTVDDVNAKK